MSRLDARDKASGSTRYVADLRPEGMVHAAVARSASPHARLLRVDTAAAAALPGVLGVFTAADITPATYGRSVRDAPILARDKVRYVGERVAAVVATSRRVAEEAAGLVVIETEELEAVTNVAEALAPGAPLVHERPWEYPYAFVAEGDPANCSSIITIGDLAEAERALAASVHFVEATYRTPAVHQAYLEPQACIAAVEDDRIHLWCTTKSPYRFRALLAKTFDLPPERIVLEPVTLGGDFGGKGSLQDAPLCIELARLVGRPVRMVLRYSEDLTTTNPRHSAEIRVRLGCDGEGRFSALATHAYLDGGAYAGFAPNAQGKVPGVLTPPGYRLPAFSAELTKVYTNMLPKGNMRAPGAPQYTFAVESAIDELAGRAGMDPVELRRRNLLKTGEPRAFGEAWAEYRGLVTLEAALRASQSVAAPAGWRTGRGVACYARRTELGTRTSFRLHPRPDGGVRVEVPLVETGAGSHEAVRGLFAARLGIPPEEVEIAQGSTADLAADDGAGGSAVTVRIAQVVDAAAKSWADRLGEEAIDVELEAAQPEVGIGSFVAQVAQVAVDPETGAVRLLELCSAVDVAAIVNEKAHQMQVDGGAVMGVGYACLEDLHCLEGQVFAANLGEFKIASVRDAPSMRTVLVYGGIGVGESNVKHIGELTTPAVAPAVANAVHAATGGRVRELPLTAERVRATTRGSDGPPGSSG